MNSLRLLVPLLGMRARLQDEAGSHKVLEPVFAVGAGGRGQRGGRSGKVGNKRPVYRVAYEWMLGAHRKRRQERNGRFIDAQYPAPELGTATVMISHRPGDVFEARHAVAGNVHVRLESSVRLLGTGVVLGMRYGHQGRYKGPTGHARGNDPRGDNQLWDWQVTQRGHDEVDFFLNWDRHSLGRRGFRRCHPRGLGHSRRMLSAEDDGTRGSLSSWTGGGRDTGARDGSLAGDPSVWRNRDRSGPR